MSATLTASVRPESKRDICESGLWVGRFYGRAWWGNRYMLLEGEPPWPDVDVNERFTEASNQPKFRRVVCRCIREPFNGDAYPVNLDSPVDEPSDRSQSSPIRRARHRSNGQLALGVGGYRYEKPGAAAINARFAAFVERRFPGENIWHLDSTRQMFLYVCAGRTVAIVMGIRRVRMWDERIDGGST